jgi:hypothetical protein
MFSKPYWQSQKTRMFSLLPETQFVLDCILGEFRTCARSTTLQNSAFMVFKFIRLALQIHLDRYVIKAARRSAGPNPEPRKSADQANGNEL